MDAWGSTSAAWTDAAQAWQPATGDATAACGAVGLALAVGSATARGDVTAACGTVGLTLAARAAQVVFSGVWTPAVSADDATIRGTTFQGTAYRVQFGRSTSYVYEAFVRFPGVDIPPGASIASAVWRRQAGYTLTTTGAAAVIHCATQDNASAPTTTAEFTALGLTSGTAWNDIPAETTDQWYDSPDFAGDIQDVIDRAGWGSGNAVLVVLKNATPEGTYANRSGWAYDQGAAYASQLVVSWTTAATGDATAACGVVSLALAALAASVRTDCTVQAGAVSLSLAAQPATAGIAVNAACGAVGLTLAAQPASVRGDVTAAVGAVALSLSAQPATATTGGDATALAGAVGLALAALAASVRTDCAAQAGAVSLTLTARAAVATCGTVADVGGLGLSLAAQAASVRTDCAAQAGTVSLALAARPATVFLLDPNDAVADVATVALTLAALAATATTATIREWITLRSPATLARSLDSAATPAVACDSPATLSKRLRSPADPRAA